MCLISENVSDHHILQTRKKPSVVNQLPEVGLEGTGDVSIMKGALGEVHVFADSNDDITLHRHDNAGLVRLDKMYH